MIRYGYNRQCDPPAPFVHVRLCCPLTGRDGGELPAQLDSAADRTVVPLKAVETLGLAQMGEVLLEGFGGHTCSLPAFLVQLQVRQLQPAIIKVVASSEEPYIILGRDVLNRFRVLLDGPNLACEIE